MKNVAVVGAGYVGLVTGACLATKDNVVTIIENNEEKIKMLLQGKVPFYEPGLDELVSKGIAEKKIVFVSSISEAMKENPEIIFSCVGTPSLPDGSADLSYVWQVAKEIGSSLNSYALVINKSTVPVSTAQKVRSIIQEQLNVKGSSVTFDVASNPEFLKEGSALDDFLNPDRVVIGTDSEKAKQLLTDLYKPFLKSTEQCISMNIESAELTKYASNAMLATRISFMNQIALLADKVGADVEDVKKGMAKDRRIGGSFLNAGIGYGGSCFPKDVRALIHMGMEHLQPMTLVREVDRVNDHQRISFFDKIFRYYGDNLKGKHAGIWGLAFKPETDDIRCAPSIDIIKKLIDFGVKVTVYDAVAQENVKQIFKDSINYADSAERVLEETDFLVLLTEWNEFKEYPLEKLTIIKDKVIFDGRNCFNPKDIQKLGLGYVTIGRKNAISKAKTTSTTTTSSSSEQSVTKQPAVAMM